MKKIEDLIELKENGLLDGVYYDIPPEVYHDPRCPGYSRSDLQNILKSYNHYLASKQNKESTPAFEFGTAFHQAILEPEKFLEFNFCEDEDPKPKKEIPKFGGSKAGKEKKIAFLEGEYTKWYDTVLVPWQEKNLHKKSWSKKDWEKINQMQMNLFTSKTALKILAGSFNEVSVFWTCPETGIILKCRPDIYNENLGIIGDLKSTEDASPNAFKKSIVKYFYDFQAAFYLQVINRVSKKEFDDFIFLAVEKIKPHGVACYNLDQETMANGEAIMAFALNKLGSCLGVLKDPVSDPSWSYPDMVQGLSLPAWANNLENRL